jgi:hypothetical protein
VESEQPFKMSDSTTAIVTKPAVITNRYPVRDSAGNITQEVGLRFICGHEEHFYSLDLGRTNGKRWKPRTTRQLFDEHLRITCPMGWKLCKACSEGRES